MPIKLKRVNECMLCTKKVTETVEQHLLDSDCIPDQSNCDFSDYKNYQIRNGILLRPLRRTEHLESSNVMWKVPVVCSTCMTRKKVHTLVEFIQKNIR